MTTDPSSSSEDHQAAVTLAQFVSNEPQRIIADWEEFARTCVPASTVIERRDHILGMLKAIVADLALPQTAYEQKEKSQGRGADAGATAAKAHGTQRAAHGYTPMQMVGEFRALRASVLRLWSKERSTFGEAEIEELTRFNEAIDEMLADSVQYFSEEIARVKDLLQADITERKRLEEVGHREAAAAVKASLSEKETLLKEIHHRVKNNLQVISSLLKLHAEEITDPVAKSAFADSQDRVKSIAILHEKLYESKNLGSIGAEEYVESLVQTLMRTHGPVPPVRVTVSAPHVSLPIDLAVPCGLILNELVTNALKHAFPRAQEIPAEIKIEIWPDGGDLVLALSDNGVGLPEDFNLSRSGTLGMHLVRTLARQLRAQVATEGTRWTFRFPRKIEA
jgi:two-component sensor histidine kinase